VPLIEARRALAGMAPGEILVVLATDPEAPIDLAALAADEGHAFERAWDSDEHRRFAGGAWRITLTKGARAR
jgi:tRNA 2-thiouridine synthesizing protein A